MTDRASCPRLYRGNKIPICHHYCHKNITEINVCFARTMGAERTSLQANRSFHATLSCIFARTSVGTLFVPSKYSMGFDHSSEVS
jgi:hypothetical protein